MPSAVGLEAEIRRVQDIWEASLSSSGGPWLLGDFSIADCMYMPLVARFRTYKVLLLELSARYATAMWGNRHVQELEQLALSEPPIVEYDALLS